MHEVFIQALTEQIVGDPRIRAGWLEGSFGRGEADRFSDLDIHLLIDENVLPGFRTGTESWLSRIRP